MSSFISLFELSLAKTLIKKSANKSIIHWIELLAIHEEVSK